MDQEFLRQYEESRLKINEAFSILASENRKIFELAINKGYKTDGNLYIHPDYWEDYLKYGLTKQYPVGVIMSCSSSF